MLADGIHAGGGAKSAKTGVVAAASPGQAAAGGKNDVC